MAFTTIKIGDRLSRFARRYVTTNSNKPESTNSVTEITRIYLSLNSMSPY